MRIKDENFICVQGWMRTDLDLKGNDLLVYAIIYGFSQTDEQVFRGSLQYLADWCGATKQGILKNLNNLVSMGLIERFEHYENRVKLVDYRTTKFNTPVEQSLTPLLNKVERPIEQSLIHNIDNNINDNIKDIIYKKQATPAPLENDPEESDFNSHAYQEETPKERYKRIKAEKKKSDYQSHAYQEERLTVKDACKEYISKFTDDESLRDVLTDYLDVRVAIKDKPLSLRTWQGMLSKLKTLDGDKVEIVKQSILENWASFYSQKPTQTQGIKQQSWDKNVSSKSMTKEDYEKMQAFLEEKAKNGERTVF